MNNKKKLTEADIAKHVVDYLHERHFEVYQEVPFRGGYVDIVAVAGLGHSAVRGQIGLIVAKEDEDVYLVYFETMRGYSTFHRREFVPTVEPITK